MSTVEYMGSNHNTDDLMNAAKKAYALISMLEAVQYSSHDLTDEFQHIGTELRFGIDDNVLSDLRNYIAGIEDVIGKINAPKPNIAVMALSMEMFINLENGAE